MARIRVLAENPPPPRGYVEDQLRELRDYITRLKDELEYLFTHLGTDNLEQGLTNKIIGAADSVEQVDEAEKALEDRVDQVETVLDGKQDTLTFDAVPTEASDNPVTSGGVFEALDDKQDTLTFDTTPTVSSTNPVTSGGVFTALDGKQNVLTFDTTPTASSTNPVTSGGVFTALDGKQDTLTFDEVPTEGSGNPVTSGGVAAFCVPVYGMGENLLDNWAFVAGGPINQRGQSSYNGSAGVDRWAVRTGMSMTVTSTGLRLSYSAGSYSDLFQRLEPSTLAYLAGKTVTLSVLDSNGVHSVTFVWDASGSGSNKGYIAEDLQIYAGGTTGAYTNLCIRAYTNNYTVMAVKLELGLTQTLARQEAGAWVLNKLPDLAAELQKCQRHFVRIYCQSGSYHRFGVANAFSATIAMCMVPLPVTMRGGTVTITASNLSLQSGASQAAISSVTFNGLSSNAVYFDASASGLTTGAMYFVKGDYMSGSLQHDGYIDVSCEI